MTQREIRDRAGKLAKSMGADSEKMMDLARLDFTIPSNMEDYRLLISTEGDEKCGKTHLPLFTMPQPVGFIDFDLGTEGLVERALDKGRIIIHKQFSLRKQADLDGTKLKIEDYKQEWLEVRKCVHALVKCDAVRTIVADTGGEMWELCRLAAFGKLTQVMPHQYGEPKADFDRLIKSPLARRGLNACYTHKVKAQYINDKRTGKKERAGFAEMAFAAQANLKHTKEDGEFGIHIVDCRKNHEVDGEELWGDMANFPTLAMMVFPDSEPSDWGEEE